MRVAIFDFDGTLYKKETFKILMDHLKHHPVYHARYNHFYRAMVPMYILYKLKLYPESKMKARSMQLYIAALNHLSETELDTYFAELANKMVDDFNDDVVKRLKQHHNDGVHVMLVSGAYTQLLQAVKEQMGFHFDMIIGTTIPLKDGIVDQHAPIYHVQGERKEEKVREVLNNKPIDWNNSFAYGDSLSDRSVLELIGNPVAVQAEPKLLSVAKEKGWEII